MAARLRLLAHQEEGEPGETHPGGSKQRRLHGRVVTHLPGGEGELGEALLGWKRESKG